MTSAILVLKYMPDMCRNCPLYDFNNRGEPICNKENKCIDSSYGRPNWCPLVELPSEEKRSDIMDEYEDGWADGFNYLRSIILNEVDYEVVN